ncbi:hypothetical protein E2C01_032644 [Portunus trituberculatus]|uniref:Uncharacterized protein n=1 Tax=Portunus trituberculatus TaxID=210409 RepID=A0A5B7F3D1_PORTR|nr:hypothetical protein [Portunus trituberculatus]
MTVPNGMAEAEHKVVAVWEGVLQICVEAGEMLRVPVLFVWKLQLLSSHHLVEGYQLILRIMSTSPKKAGANRSLQRSSVKQASTTTHCSALLCCEDCLLDFVKSPAVNVASHAVFMDSSDQVMSGTRTVQVGNEAMYCDRLRNSRDSNSYSSSGEWADEALLCRSITFSPAFFIASRFFNTIQTVGWARPKF